LNNKFLFFSALALGPIIDKNAQGLGVRGVTRSFLSGLMIPVPDLKTQDLVVSKIEAELSAVSTAKDLIRSFEQKVKDRIAKVWGEKI
jgi:type I restriction enzyme M protein